MVLATLAFRESPFPVLYKSDSVLLDSILIRFEYFLVNPSSARVFGMELFGRKSAKDDTRGTSDDVSQFTPRSHLKYSMNSE